MSEKNRNLIYDNWKWLPSLLTRLVVGFVFANGGWNKLQNIDHIITQYSQSGIPYAPTISYLVAFIELIGGVLLILGLFTRICVLPLILIEAIAIFTVKFSQISSLPQMLNFTECLYILLFIGLAINGPGSVSIDHRRHMTK